VHGLADSGDQFVIRDIFQVSDVDPPGNNRCDDPEIILRALGANLPLTLFASQSAYKSAMKASPSLLREPF
jgi:hypothetical protein